MTIPNSIHRANCALAAFICLVAGIGHAQENPAKKIPLIAVMPLTGQGIDDASSQIVTDALADELIKTGKVRVMERTQMEKILREQGFQKTGSCDGSECAVEVGKLLSIDRIVVGSLGKIGGSYTVTARSVNVGTGEILGSARRIQKGEIELIMTDMLPPLALELAQRMSGNDPVAVAEKVIPKLVAPVVVDTPKPVPPVAVVAPKPVLAPAPVVAPPAPAAPKASPAASDAASGSSPRLRAELGGRLLLVRPSFQQGSYYPREIMSSSPGFGARISGAGVYQLNSLFSMNAGLGISRQTFTEKFIDEGSDSWGSYRDVVEVSIALNMVDLNLGATLRPWRNLVVGLDGGYCLPIGGSAKIKASSTQTSSFSGTSTTSDTSFTWAVQDAPSTRPDKRTAFLVQGYFVYGGRLGWEIFPGITADLSILLAATGVNAQYDNEDKLKPAQRKGNFMVNTIGLGGRYLF
ncbi:MAG: Curli production assembly/transport component CsgG [Fibrobacterota bacterium]|jgi:TolB-like protein